MRALLLGLVPPFAYVQPAFAAPVDLSGTWVLDKAASDNIDPILQAGGASWVERQAAKNLKITRTIRQEGDTLHIAVDSSVKDSQETVTVDGVARPGTTDRGELATVTNRWDGEAWVSESVVTHDNAPTVRVTQKSSLSADGSTLTTSVQFVRGDEAPIVVDRVYRRK